MLIRILFTIMFFVIGVMPICFAEKPLPETLYNPETGRDETVRDMRSRFSQSRSEIEEHRVDLEKIRKERQKEKEEQKT